METETTAGEPDRCVRAAQAAIEVVREECAGMDMEVRELDGGMFMEIPTEAAEAIDSASGSPVTMGEFAEMVDQTEFVREWLAGRATSTGVEPDYTDRAFAGAVHGLASSIMDDGVAFSPADLRGSRALETIAEDV